MFRNLKFCCLVIIFSILTLGSGTPAQQLIYQPVNPSFGGSPLNGNWLISSAQAQDNNTDPNASTQETNPIDDFKKQLSRSILNQLSRDLISSTFGETGIQPGKFEIGDFIIDISETSEGLNIVIFDIITGDETTILVPYL